MISFGKYKNQTIDWLVQNDVNYCKWAIENLTNSNSSTIKSLIKQLKEKYDKTYANCINFAESDKLLQTAWYTKNSAKKLLKYDLDPSLSTFSEDHLKKPIFEDEDVDLIDYLDYLGICVKNNRDALDKIHDLGLTINDKIIKRKIAKSAIALRPIYDKNRKWDKKQIHPTKIILKNWLFPKTIKNIGTGKWCLYFDKMNEDENGLTELDRNYLILKENYGKITKQFDFKCSTRKPNPNAGNDNTNGVIIIYCDENTRDKIIKKIDKLLCLKGKIYWKEHSNSYAKTGVKASNYSYSKK